ncbi:protein qua-1-like isoform X2 [Pararge aegeria]|uniref:protein qua-1-like isoform X2 n=1 Tax=Pararge aegeria TaxID=116150 RepID=UPI0019D02D1A|nr:protein qua-1-like isoform X2 [Pararge aegeria]
MHAPRFFIFCVVALFAIAEATPWYRSNPTKRNQEVAESDNNGASDFGVEEFGGNAGDTARKSGGGLISVDLENQDADTNQEAKEGVDEQGGEINPGGEVYQGGRRFQGGRGYQPRRRPQGGLNTGGRGNLGGRGYTGGRGNQNSAEDSDYEDSNEELSGRKNVIAARWLPKYRNYGFQNRYHYGYDVRFPSSVESGFKAANFGEPDDIDLYHSGNRPYGNEEDVSWQERNPARRGNPNGRRIQGGGQYQGMNRNQFGGGNHGSNGNQYGNKNKEGDSNVENNENPNGVQNPSGDLDPNGVKWNPGDINYDSDKGLGTETQSSNDGQNVNKGQAGKDMTANKNRSRNQDGGRHANWNPGFLNVGNGEGNKNTVYLPY